MSVKVDLNGTAESEFYIGKGKIGTVGQPIIGFRQNSGKAEYKDSGGDWRQCGNIIIGTTASFPTGSVGLFFWATNIKTLFQHDGTEWKPHASYAAVSMYVDGTDGTDANGYGYASGSSAFKTIGYAIDNIPTSYGGEINIYLSADTYTGEIVWGGKNPSGAYDIIFHGTPSQYYSGGVITSYTAGSTAANGTITVSGASWTTNEFVDKYLFINDVDINGGIIASNTADTITVRGNIKEDPTGETFVVRDWSTASNTVINNSSSSWEQIEQINVIIRDVEFLGGFSADYDTFCYGCRFATDRGRGVSGNVRLLGCLAEDNDVGSIPKKVLAPDFMRVFGSVVRCNRASASGVGVNLVIGDKFIGYNTLYKNFATGIKINQSTAYVVDDANIIEDCTVGVYALNGSILRINEPDEPTFTNCGTDIQWDDERIGHQLDIEGKGNTSSTYVFNASNSDGNPIVKMRDDQRLGVKTASPASTLDVNGETRIGSSSNYTKIASDGRQTMIGDARVEKKDTFLVNQLRVTQGAPAGKAVRQVGASGNVYEQVASFSATVDQECFLTYSARADIDGSESVSFRVIWRPGASWTSGNYIWKIEYLVMGDNADRTAGTPTTSSVDVTPSNANNGILSTFLTAIDLNANDVLFLRFYRDAVTDTGNDVGDVELFQIVYTANSLGEQPE
jgi:hypothetical protein